MWSVPIGYKRDEIWNCQFVLSSIREPVKRGIEPGGGGIAIVGALTRKRLITEKEH
jgi:hypothetical protein